MNARRYRALLAWFGARPAAKAALRALSVGAVAAVYLLYAGLLGYTALTRPALLPAAAGVPAGVFVLGTALRRLIDRPRPYEALDFAPLFPKDTRGQSFPSRHCFSAAGIAVAAWYVSPPLAGVLALLALLIALTRVLCCVHYISDVAAGLAFGAAASWAGFLLASALGLPL